MSTSIFRYPVLAGTAVYGDAADPVDATVMRDAVANSLLHYADSFAQVRVAAAFPGSAVTYNGAAQGGVEASPTADQFYLLSGGVLGPWPITLHADGTPYQLRIRVRGRTTNAAGSCTFRLVLCPLGRAFEYIDSAAVDFVWTSDAVTATSPAWLTGTTPLHSLANRLSIDSEVALSSGWLARGISSPNSATEPRSIQQCLVALHVFAKTTNNTGVPQLYGLIGQEYVGA